MASWLTKFWQSYNFSVFCKFFSDKLKPFSRKVRQGVQNYLNQNLVIRSFLENGFGATLSSKWIFWTFDKGIFQFFAKFWVTKLKSFSGKVRKSVQNYLNQNLVIRTFLENGFGATLSSKTNVMFWAFEKSIFQFFANFWVTKLKPFFEKVR